MRIMAWRRLSQLAAVALLLVPVLWPANAVWFGTYVSSQLLGFALTDPVAALEVTLAGKTVWWPLVWSAAPLLAVTLVLGRIFCSWVCPLNTALEFAAAGKTPRTGASVNTWWPYRLLAGFMLLAISIGLPLFTIISPIGMLSRALVFGAGPELLLVAGLVTAERIYNRKIWCRTVCPVGAFYGLIGARRLLNVIIRRPLCQDCGSCHKACTMGVTVAGASPLDRLNCTNCGDCIDACPERAVAFTWKIGKKGGAWQNESMDSIKG
jgi:ferredoxin-type protein NapH